jgi:predicted nucleic acid-binding protein
VNVLVDTSVWVGHFRARNDALVNLLLEDRGLTHPMILGELTCGTPPEPRARTLGDIELLAQVNQASYPEVRQFVEREKLYGSGCGLVDLTLLASTLITPGTTLWTHDRHLAEIAARFGVAFAATTR